MESTRNKTIRSLFWSAIEKYSRLVISLVISMVLARLLSPEEYGLVAIVTVIISFLQLFCTMGIAPAIIQRKDFNEEDYNNLFTFTASIGLIITIICFILSKAIANFYGNDQLVNITRLLSLNLFFASLNLVPNALMAKNLRFKEIAVRTLILQILSGAVGIFMAFKGFGVYALIVPDFITAFFIFLYNRRYYKVSINIRFSLEPVRRIFSYSSYQFLFSIMNFFTGNVDKLIIGSYLSAAALGIYDKAYRLMQMPLQNVTSVISPVLHPILSNFQDDLLDMAIKYNRVVKTISLLSFPIAVILYFVAKELIIVLFGPNWNGAIPCLQILSISLPTHMILATSGSIWQASNYTKYLFWVGTVNTLTVVLGFIVAALFWKTIESVAWAWTITAYLNFCFTYVIMYYKIFHSSFYSMIKILVMPSNMAILLLIGYLILENFYHEINVLADLIIKVFYGIVITLFVLHISGQLDCLALIKKITSKCMKQ